MDRRSFLSSAALGLAAGAVPIGCARTDPAVDPALPSYRSVPGVRGTLISNGSDTMSALMSSWARGFETVYPGDRVRIEAKGSNTALPSLIAGTAQIGPMSRPATKTEEDDFEAKFGYKVSRIRAAVDALAVIVNKGNPLKALTLEQLDAVYSKSRRRGIFRPAVTWGDVGLSGEWKGKPISLYGRNSRSGTSVFFKEQVLLNGDYREEVQEMSGTSSVVQAVATDLLGIGFVGIGTVTSSVKVLAIPAQDGLTPVEPSEKNTYSGEYPLSRYLYVYFNRSPGKDMEPVVREFIRFICSKEGQEQVVKAGYYPIPESITAVEVRRIE
jgi:phosphate transport system substrate-binding protein